MSPPWRPASPSSCLSKGAEPAQGQGAAGRWSWALPQAARRAPGQGGECADQSAVPRHQGSGETSGSRHGVANRPGGRSGKSGSSRVPGGAGDNGGQSLVARRATRGREPGTRATGLKPVCHGRRSPVHDGRAAVHRLGRRGQDTGRQAAKQRPPRKGAASAPSPRGPSQRSSVK